MESKVEGLRRLDPDRVTATESLAAAGVELSRVDERVISTREAQNRTGLSRTSLWRLERAGGFPMRRRLSSNRVGWLESEVVAWMRTRPLGR